LKNEFLVIDRIIEDYPDSDHSIEFIVNILSPPLDIHSIRYHQGIYDISMTFEKLPEKLSKRLITESKV
jgi:hypothetical protein